MTTDSMTKTQLRERARKATNQQLRTLGEFLQEMVDRLNAQRKETEYLLKYGAWDMDEEEEQVNALTLTVARLAHHLALQDAVLDEQERRAEAEEDLQQIPA